jgi:outer membrane protein assembly factor BamB/predicted MPP superfamily phosphohydrolase
MLKQHAGTAARRAPTDAQWFGRTGRTCTIMGLFLSLMLLLDPWLLFASNDALRFAWLSDTHVGSTAASEDLRAAVSDINSMTGLSFVLISGDVTEYGSREQFRLAKEILDGLALPYHVLPGNHDTKWSESGGTDFGRFWGQDRFSFEIDGFRFIGLHQGPLMKMGDGHWAPQDVRWLKRTLRRLHYRTQPVIFLTHYPLDDGIANWFVVLDLLKQYNIQAILCGHGHSNRKLFFEGIPGVMGRSCLHTAKSGAGYNLVEVKDGRMTFSERITRQETKPSWHSVALRKTNSRSSNSGWPRPDFAINEHYPLVRERWTYQAGYTIAGSPAVWNDRVIIGDTSGAIRALSIDTGRPIWKFKTGNAVSATPAVGLDLVICPSTDGIIYALNAANGKAVWRFVTKRPIVASPAIASGVIYIGSSEDKFRALDLATGQLRWQFAGLKGFIETKPLLDEDKVVFGAWDQHLYALDRRTGKLIWTWKGDQPGTLYSPAACWPVAGHGKVFIVAPDRRMTAIDSATGSQVWRTADDRVRESIGLSKDGSRFYVREMNDFFHAFSTTSTAPEELWRTNGQFGYDINSAMLIEKDGVVFYGTKNGLLLAIDSASGTILWKHRVGVALLNTVLPLSASQVVTTDFDGKVALVVSETKR